MATLQELMAQKEAIEQQIEQTKKQERGDAIDKVRALMAEYGLTAADIGGKAAPSGRKAKSGRRQGRRRSIATPPPGNPGAAAACSRAG